MNSCVIQITTHKNLISGIRSFWEVMVGWLLTNGMLFLSISIDHPDIQSLEYLENVCKIQFVHINLLDKKQQWEWLEQVLFYIYSISNNRETGKI